MKHLNKEQLTFMLCATGYIPPRTEEEQIFFEQMYEDYSPKLKDRHVDVDAIITGHCRFMSVDDLRSNLEGRNESIKLNHAAHMAARNLHTLKKEVLEKIQKQHTREK